MKIGEDYDENDDAKKTDNSNDNHHYHDHCTDINNEDNWKRTLTKHMFAPAKKDVKSHFIGEDIKLSFATMPTPEKD